MEKKFGGVELIILLNLITIGLFVKSYPLAKADIWSRPLIQNYLMTSLVILSALLILVSIGLWKRKELAKTLQVLLILLAGLINLKIRIIGPLIFLAIIITSFYLVKNKKIKEEFEKGSNLKKEIPKTIKIVRLSDFFLGIILIAHGTFEFVNRAEYITRSITNPVGLVIIGTLYLVLGLFIAKPKKILRTTQFYISLVALLIFVYAFLNAFTDVVTIAAPIILLLPTILMTLIIFAALNSKQAKEYYTE